jgi:hypothetical protein
MKDLCACINLVVLGIQFNLYDNSNCTVDTHDARLHTFHSVPLTMMIKCSALLS